MADGRPSFPNRISTRLAVAFGATSVMSVVLVVAMVLAGTRGGVDRLLEDERDAVVADVTTALAVAYESAGGWEGADLLPAHLLAASAGAVLVVATDEGEVLPEPSDIGAIRERIREQESTQGAPDTAPTPGPDRTPTGQPTEPSPSPTRSPGRHGGGDPPSSPPARDEPVDPGRDAPSSPEDPSPSQPPSSPSPRDERGPSSTTGTPRPSPTIAPTEPVREGDAPGRGRPEPRGLTFPLGRVVLAVAEAPSEVDDERAAPVVVDGREVGTATLLFVVQERPGPADVLRSSLLRSIVVAGLAAMLLAFVIAVGVATRLSRPLRRLTAVVERIAHRDRWARTDLPQAVGELGVLARSVDRMAEDLELEDRLRRALVADIAHEVRTPLSVLLAEVEALEDGIVAPDAERLSSLHEEVLRLARLIEDLDAIAAAEAAVTELRRERVDLAEVAVAALDGLGDRFAARGITVTTDLEPVPVTGDRRRLEQVVRNLLTNAAKFAPEAGAVTLAVGLRRGRALLEVTDDGPGIPEEELDHLFERFWRGRAAVGVPGSGIGLAVVAELVAAHGGEVVAENVPGRGVRFSVALPIEPRDDRGRDERPEVLVEAATD